MKTIWKVLIIAVLVIIIGGLAFWIYMKSTYLSKDEVKDIVIKDINQNANDIYFESVEFESDEEAYDVNLYYNNKEYEYKIDAKNGRIIYTDFVNSNNNSSNTQNNQNTTTNNNGTGQQNGQNNGNQNNQNANGISLTEAKQIAFDHAGVKESEITLVKSVHEVENGIDVFEIEFNDSTYEYEFTINKNNGEIISYDKDHLHR